MDIDTFQNRLIKMDGKLVFRHPDLLQQHMQFTDSFQMEGPFRLKRREADSRAPLPLKSLLYLIPKTNTAFIQPILQQREFLQI